MRAVLGGDNTKCDGTVRWMGTCTHKKLKDKERIGIELDKAVSRTAAPTHISPSCDSHTHNHWH